MSIIKNKIGALIMVLISSIGFAQQLPQFSQYMYNTISINPAYAGSRETLSIVGLHRSQWTDIQGGPTTQTISVHSPLGNDKIGLGLSIINDSPGFENFLYAYADFSYSIDVGRDTRLAFGLKGGFTHYNLDEVFLMDPDVLNDPFFGNYTDKWNPNIGAGVYLHSNMWYLGLSAPRIINNDYNLDNESTTTINFIATERISYYFTGGYVFDLAKAIKLKPSFLVKATNGAPISIDFNANVFLYDRFEIGASYRYNDNTGALAAMAGFEVVDGLMIGYAYDHYISDVRPYFGGTHEVMLRFELNQEKPGRVRVKSPRYF